MNNQNYFKIENGILEYYSGNNDVVTVPEGVVAIGSLAFYRHKNLRRVIIPNSVKKIDRYAFQHCSNLREIMIPTSVEKIEERAFSHSGLEEITIPKNVRTIGECAFSYCLKLTKLTVLSEKCKGTSVFYGCKSLKYITGNISGFISESFSGCPRELSYFVCIRDKAKQIDAVIDWLCGDRMEIDDVDAIFDFARKNRMNILATLVERENIKAIDELLKIPDIGLTYKDADYALQCAKADSQNVRRLEEKYIDKNAQRTTIEDVYYKNSHLPCSGALWNELITEASTKEVVLSEKANEILEVLDETSVNEYLKKVVEKIPSQEQITFARLANDESIEWSIQLISSRRRNTHPQMLWAERMLDALYYSNTQTAKDYIVKKGDLGKYAKMRGYCEQEYRDLVILPDFGFDKNGVREFVAGGKDYQARISPDFKMNIVEVATGKTVRKLPAKTKEDAQVADCVAKLKKDVEEFYELRKQYWRRIFIQGETISEKVFNQAYLSKPIFTPIVSSLIWESESGTFFEVNDGVAEKLDGSQYVISEPVKIAHFLDMTDDQREQWREKIEKENKTLIAEQLPLFVGEMDEFKDVVHRYKDLELTEDARTKMRKTLQNYSVKIESVVEYSYDYDFDRREYFDDGVMKFGKHFSLPYKIKTAHELFVLGDMKCDIEDTDSVKREMYLILRVLDDAVIRSAISRNANMTSMEKYLSGATYEQIQEYIDYATAQDNHGFVAILLEYRNKKYGDREVFDQFLI